MSILWESNKKIDKTESGFLLSGIYSNGSIYSSRISFSKKVQINFKFMVHEEYQDHAALIDIDFDNLIDEKVLFTSLVFSKKKGKLNFFVRKGEADFHVEYRMANQLWHDCLIELTYSQDSRIQIITTIDNECIAQVFLPQKSDGLWVSFGNNHVEPSDDATNSFEIRDIYITVDEETQGLTEVVPKSPWAPYSIHSRV